MAFPSIMRGAQDDKPVIGEGEFRFQCFHDWGKLPKNHSYGGASHGVALDKLGNVYISHTGGPGSVFVFDPEGKFMRSMAPQHEGEGHGIEIREEDGAEFIYLSPNSFKHKQAPYKATKMTLDGKVVWEGGAPKESGKYPQGALFNATNISFCPDGGWHVGDGYGSHFLHRYDKNGKYLASFGGKGNQPGQFATPHGHWFDDRKDNNQLVVCDRANNRLQLMGLNGEFKNQVPGIEGPASLDIQGDTMVCSEVFIGRIAFLDTDYKVVARLNADPAWQKMLKEIPGFRKIENRPKWLPGKFVHPHDATFDAQGNLFVTEWVVGGRVTKLVKV